MDIISKGPFKWRDRIQRKMKASWGSRVDGTEEAEDRNVDLIFADFYEGMKERGGSWRDV